MAKNPFEGIDPAGIELLMKKGKTRSNLALSNHRRRMYEESGSPLWAWIELQDANVRNEMPQNWVRDYFDRVTDQLTSLNPNAGIDDVAQAVEMRDAIGGSSGRAIADFHRAERDYRLASSVRFNLMWQEADCRSRDVPVNAIKEKAYRDASEVISEKRTRTERRRIRIGDPRHVSRNIAKRAYERYGDLVEEILWASIDIRDGKFDGDDPNE